MRYLALATDYDGTLARDGKVSTSTLNALERLRNSGRKTVLVTGRELEDLSRTFDHPEYFDSIVAENGAVLYNPSKQAETVLAERPPARFADLLQRRGVAPLGAGRVIVSTREPFQNVALETIRELGLELQLIFNKGSVMILPAGVNKATGLVRALQELNLSAHNVAGIGDAENDHAFLDLCECSAAVGNALPSLKERADVVLTGECGTAVEEFVERLLRNDLADAAPARRSITIGKTLEEWPVRVPAYGPNLLVAGTSGGGKSSATTTFLEGLVADGRQFCAIDPEGDYQTFEGALVLGDAGHGPTPDEILAVLDDPSKSVILNLLGVPVKSRPDYFAALYPHLAELRGRTGRPHWIAVDEALHVLRNDWNPAAGEMPEKLHSSILVTLRPDDLPKPILEQIDLLIAMGDEAAGTVRLFCEWTGRNCPELDDAALEKHEAWGFWVKRGEGPFRFRVAPSQTTRVRRSRKYATAELTPDRSFYFRGPEGKLNLRAPNLATFLKLADGVDADTWQYHLHRGEYSRWFRENIKDEELADQARKIEKQPLSNAESRRRIREMIENRYALPA